jgi:glycosyltransferase involved in cell wall biosynthesis
VPHTPVAFGVVAIGRNEGDRLKQCLGSVSGAKQVVYVDSGSTDGSVQWARHLGIEIVDLDLTIPFTAARARNSGFRRLKELAPDLDYVQFIDGDCELNKDWPCEALTFLDDNPRVAATFGRRRERFPERSIYNRLCDKEWDTPIGEAAACGGDVMIRVGAFQAVEGFRDMLIAGEEPELCLRLRALGWKIWRLDHEMTTHDAAMIHFHQWWLRQMRSGYAFAQGAYLHGWHPERHWVWESARALLWGIGFPLVFIGALIGLGWLGLMLLIVYPLQIVRRATQMPGRRLDRLRFACLEQLTRFPEALGQLRFARDWLLGRQGRLIEYK